MKLSYIRSTLLEYLSANFKFKKLTTADSTTPSKVAGVQAKHDATKTLGYGKDTKAITVNGVTKIYKLIDGKYVKVADAVDGNVNEV